MTPQCVYLHLSLAQAGVNHLVQSSPLDGRDAAREALARVRGAVQLELVAVGHGAVLLE